MILDAARLSLINLFAPETRSAFWKTLGLTFLILIGLLRQEKVGLRRAELRSARGEVDRKGVGTLVA